MTPDRQVRAVAGAAVAALANALVLAAPGATLKLIGGLLLFCLLPGYLIVTALLPGARPRSWWAEVERLVLGVGASFALSVLAMLVLQWVPGQISVGRVLLANDLLVIVGIAALVVGSGQPHRAAPTADDQRGDAEEPMPRLVILGLVAVLVLGGALRTIDLGYSEFQDDEIDITQVALQVVLGDPSVVLEDTRGPARTMLVTAFFLYTDRVGEIDVRAASAAASVVTILALFWLGRRLFSPSVGLLAAAVVAVEGITLGYGRIVQQEDLINMWAVLAILCFLLARERGDSPSTTVYQSLGALFFAAGLLAHYEVALLSPILLWLWLTGRRSMPAARWWKSSLLSALIAVLTAASFYTSFILNPRFGATYRYYSTDILGSGLADNLGQFLNVSTFYNSAYFVVAIVLLLSAACALSLWQRDRRLAWVVGIGSLGLWGASAAFPGRLAGFGLLWFGAICIVVLALAADESLKIVLVWLAMYFVPYVYVVQAPHMHFYAFSMPLALLVGYGLYKLWTVLASRPAAAGRPRDWTTTQGRPYAGGAGRGAGDVLRSGDLPRRRPAREPSAQWAVVQPEKPVPLHPTLHSGRPGEYFGMPQKSGWRTVAALYRAGVLRGPYETNELYQKVDWYLRRLIRRPGENRYYFVSESPHRLQAGPLPEPFVAADYWPIGLVTVDGEPKLRLYERKDANASASPPQVVTYANETYEAAADSVRPLSTYRLWREYQADDQFFVDVAAHLASAVRPGDALILDAPAQAEILSYYYTGNLPYHALPVSQQSEDGLARDLEGAVAGHPRVFASLWATDSADPGGRVESWLDQKLFKADSQWFGNARLVTYAAPQEGGGQIAQPVGARLGDAITLASYGVEAKSYKPGDILPLTLYWQCTGAVSLRYKVFVHLTAQGQIAAQRDSEPAGGSRPTDGWRAGDAVTDNEGVALPDDMAPGRYDIVVGMYDPATGDRLAAVSGDGQPLIDDCIVLGAVEVGAR